MTGENIVEKYKSGLNKLEEYILHFKTHCAQFNSDKRPKNEDNCWLARDYLNDICRQCRKLGIYYGRDRKNADRIDEEFGTAANWIISHFVGEHHDFACRKGECGITVGGIIDLEEAIKEIKKGNKMDFIREVPASDQQYFR